MSEQCERTTERCERTSKQTSEWPSTAVWILDIGPLLMHCGTKPGHFETSKIHFPTSEGVSEVSGASERANGRASGPVLTSVLFSIFDHSDLQSISHGIHSYPSQVFRHFRVDSGVSRSSTTIAPRNNADQSQFAPNLK